MAWIHILRVCLLTAAAALLLYLSSAVSAAEFPAGSHLDRFEVIKIHRQYGIEQSAKLMAQEEVESGGRDDAVSPVGARGRCQFMPATAKAFEKAYPNVLTKWTRYSRDWCRRAQSLYIRDELRRSWYPPENVCASYEYAFRAYNGGGGWLGRERRIAGRDATPAQLRAVCRQAGRSAAACRENTRYTDKIYKREPKYIGLGYPGGPPCPAI